MNKYEVYTVYHTSYENVIMNCALEEFGALMGFRDTAEVDAYVSGAVDALYLLCSIPKYETRARIQDELAKIIDPKEA